MSLQRAVAGGGEQFASLVGIEIEGSLQHRPGGREKEERRGKVKKERSTRGRPAWHRVLADGLTQTLERRPDGRFQGLDRDLAAIRQIAKEEAGVGRSSFHLIEDSVENLGDGEGRGVLTAVDVRDGEIGECRCRPPENRSIELLLSSEVVGDRAGIGAGQVADAANRGSSIAVLGKESGRSLQKALFCV